MKKIKQLVWEDANNRYGHVEKAATPFGPYSVFGDGSIWTPGGGHVENGMVNGDGDYKNDRIKEAKALAQVDFEKRVADCYDEEEETV